MIIKVLEFYFTQKLKSKINILYFKANFYNLKSLNFTFKKYNYFNWF